MTCTAHIYGFSVTCTDAQPRFGRWNSLFFTLMPGMRPRDGLADDWIHGHLVTSEPLARLPIAEIRLFPGKIQQYTGSQNAQRFTIRDFCGPAFDMSQMAKE